MDKFKLLSELVQAMGLKPQQVVDYWHDNGMINLTGADGQKTSAQPRKSLRKLLV
jgi:hypothetical protein